MTEPKNQKRIKFINCCNCIVDETCLENAILWYQNRNTISKKKIYIHGKYPAVSIHNEKIHVHRLLLMWVEKRKLNKLEYVHHKDHNKLNSSIDNLEIIYCSDHQSMHNKNKKLSIDHRAKISESNKKRKGIRHRNLIDIDLFDLKKMINSKMSINLIAKHFKCDWSTIRNRIHDNPELLNQ